MITEKKLQKALQAVHDNANQNLHVNRWIDNEAYRLEDLKDNTKIELVKELASALGLKIVKWDPLE